MDIAPTQSTQNTPATSATEGTAAAAEADIEEQLDTFLTLLTAQVKNQDPLSPLDSTQFVDQLATFTGLEQQVTSNKHLENISSQMASVLSMVSNDWIGKNVAVESSYIPIEGQPISFTADLADEADQAIFKVTNEQGTIIHTETLDKEAKNWSWNAQYADGTPVPNALYKTSIDLYKDNEFLGSVAPKYLTNVTQASLENGKVLLGFSNKLSEYADNLSPEI